MFVRSAHGGRTRQKSGGRRPEGARPANTSVEEGDPWPKDAPFPRAGTALVHRAASTGKPGLQYAWSGPDSGTAINRNPGAGLQRDPATARIVANDFRGRRRPAGAGGS